MSCTEWNCTPTLKDEKASQACSAQPLVRDHYPEHIYLVPPSQSPSSSPKHQSDFLTHGLKDVQLSMRTLHTDIYITYMYLHNESSLHREPAPVPTLHTTIVMLHPGVQNPEHTIAKPTCQTGLTLLKTSFSSNKTCMSFHRTIQAYICPHHTV